MKTKYISEVDTFENFEGYTVCDNGTVFSHMVRKNHSWVVDKNRKKPVKPYRIRKGYLKVDIRSRSVFLHRLVALAFIPNPENKPQINHINANKEDNSVENLEWVTNQENHVHKLKNGLNVSLSGEACWLHGKCGKLHPCSKKVKQKDLNGEELKIFDSISDAAKELGVNYSGISKCCNGHKKTAFGYKWEFIG